MITTSHWLKWPSLEKLVLVPFDEVERWARRRARKVVKHSAGCPCWLCATVRVRVKRAFRSRFRPGSCVVLL
jgi:hypothetical protein